MLWYMLLYGLERAMVEGLRTDSLYLGPLRVSQALSIILIFAAALIFALRMKRSRLMTAAAVVSAAAAMLSLFNMIYPALILAVSAVILISAAYTRVKTGIA